MKRRSFLGFLLSGCAATTIFVGGHARADDDEEDNSGSGSSDHSGSDDDSSSGSKPESDSDSSDHSYASESSDDGSSHDESDDDHSDDSSYGSDSEDEHDDDQYEARNAVQNEEAVPLIDILTAFNKRFRGQVIDVRLIRPLFHLQYRLTYIDEFGSVRRAYFDAKTGDFVK